MWSDELVEQARAVGLDGVCITEHDSFWAPDRIERLSERHGFLVIGGAEIASDWGDVLVFGVTELPHNVSAIGEIRRRVDEAGGVVIAAHPFRSVAVGGGITPSLVARLAGSPLLQSVHDLEVLNGASRPAERRLAKAVADRLGRSGTGGSDAHGIAMVGACHTCFEDEIKNEADFVAALRAGRFRPGDSLAIQ